MGGIRDRVRQFREANLAPGPDDLALARHVIGDGALLELFLRQTPRDIRHAAATARWLTGRGHLEDELVTAALLHDVGKGMQRRCDRVAWVIAQGLRLERVAASADSGLECRRAMARTANHAVNGAELLASAGAPARVVDLTRRHHSAPEGDAMLALLQAADAAS